MDNITKTTLAVRISRLDRENVEKLPYLDQAQGEVILGPDATPNTITTDQQGPEFGLPTQEALTRLADHHAREGLHRTANHLRNYASLLKEFGKPEPTTERTEPEFTHSDADLNDLLNLTAQYSRGELIGDGALMWANALDKVEGRLSPPLDLEDNVIVLKPCPFCGMQQSAKDEDTLHPTGARWRLDGRDIISVHPDEALESDGRMWVVRCAQNYGGCGAQVTSFSEESVVNIWNRRPPSSDSEGSVMQNGLTEEETSCTASVMGLSNKKLSDMEVATILSELPAPPVSDGKALHGWAMELTQVIYTK